MQIEADQNNATLNPPGKALRYTNEDAPKKCSFPFKYQGITYNDCTDHGAPANQTWCMTDAAGSWNWCQCKEKRYTVSGKRCLCPASYNGWNMGSKGVAVSDGQEWCFTKNNGAWDWVLPVNGTDILDKLTSDTCLRAKSRFICASQIKRCDDSSGKPVGLPLCSIEFTNLVKECGSGAAKAMVDAYGAKIAGNDTSDCTTFVNSTIGTFAKKVGVLRKLPKHVGGVPKAKSLKFCVSSHGVTYEVATEDGVFPNVTDKRAKDLFNSILGGKPEDQTYECQSALQSVICRYMYQRVIDDGAALPVCSQTCENLRGKCGQKIFDTLLGEVPGCADEPSTNCTGADFHGAALQFDEEPKEDAATSRELRAIDGYGPEDTGKTSPLPPEEQMKGPTIINKAQFCSKTFAGVLVGACVAVLMATTVVSKQEVLVNILFPRNPYASLNKE